MLRQKLFKKTNFKRILIFLIGDLIFIPLSCWLGFLLRFDGQIPSHYWLMIKGFISVATPLVIFFFVLERLYSISWSFVSVRELLRVIRAIVAGFLGVGAILFVFRETSLFSGFPRSIIFISGFIALILTGGFRFAKRATSYSFKNGIHLHNNEDQKHSYPILIVGAGDAGEQLARNLLSRQDSSYSPVGFIDDDQSKQDILIHGIKVLGKIKNLPEIIKKNNIDEIFIALPSAEKKIIQETVNLSRSAGIQKIKILPTTKEILDGKISLSHLREISIEDLLGREPIKIDTQTIENFLNNKIILVTGAAGSIGSQLCQEILKFGPKQLICLDQDETATFYLENDLKKIGLLTPKSFIIADICDKNKIENIFETFKPNVVFHAAAYKHVPMMECNPEEAVKNNIFGTITVGQAAIKSGVEKFVMISTDKAINPTSIMGATKRVCEMVCVWLNKSFNKTQDYKSSGGVAPVNSSRNDPVTMTRFCAVRFGNVLGSQGSVVGLFERQIKKGGPVEVTHPEMKRYFMITAEACLLVMQAGALGQGGEIFVLDMGEPVKIVDLAREMIKLAGYEPDVDVPIVFTQIRPGEKLFEELLKKNEIPTKHEKIFIAQLTDIDEQKFLNSLNEFQKDLQKNDKIAIIKTLNDLVPIQGLNNK